MCSPSGSCNCANEFCSGAPCHVVILASALGSRARALADSNCWLALAAQNRQGFGATSSSLLTKIVDVCLTVQHTAHRLSVQLGLATGHLLLAKAALVGVAVVHKLVLCCPSSHLGLATCFFCCTPGALAMVLCTTTVLLSVVGVLTRSVLTSTDSRSVKLV